VDAERLELLLSGLLPAVVQLLQVFGFEQQPPVFLVLIGIQLAFGGVAAFPRVDVLVLVLLFLLLCVWIVCVSCLGLKVHERFNCFILALF